MPLTVGSPRSGFRGNDVTHFSTAWPPPRAGMARKSPSGRRRHVDLGGHQPVAARVVDERAADGLDRVGGIDGRVHVPRGKDGNTHGGAYPRPPEW